MKKVYIASPYTKGDIAVNVRVQIDTADRLMNYNLAPYVPLLCHFQHLVHHRSYKDWMTLTTEWLQKCDAVLRLPGESNGADEEVAFARVEGIPVFFTEEELISWSKL